MVNMKLLCENMFRTTTRIALNKSWVPFILLRVISNGEQKGFFGAVN